MAEGTNYQQLFEGLMSRLSTGGEFLKSSLADIESGKRRSIASSMQNIVSSGLSGTTVRAGVPLAAEETAGRARLAARGAAEKEHTGITSQFAHLSEAARQAGLERTSALERTRLLAGSQETMQVRDIAAQRAAQERALSQLGASGGGASGGGYTSPSSASWMNEGGTAGGGAVGGTGTGVATPAAADPEAEWKAFKRANPYYMRGKDKWMESRGYTSATTDTPPLLPASTAPSSFYGAAHSILGGQMPEDISGPFGFQTDYAAPKDFMGNPIR